jgi:hypothetical protein
MKVIRPASAGLAIVLVAIVVLILAVTGGSAKKNQSSIAAGSAVSVSETPLGKTPC